MENDKSGVLYSKHPCIVGASYFNILRTLLLRVAPIITELSCADRLSLVSDATIPCKDQEDAQSITTNSQAGGKPHTELEKHGSW